MAEVSLLRLMTFCISGMASVMRIRMTDMTMSSSTRVKPASTAEERRSERAVCKAGVLCQGMTTQKYRRTGSQLVMRLRIPEKRYRVHLAHQVAARDREMPKVSEQRKRQTLGIEELLRQPLHIGRAHPVDLSGDLLGREEAAVIHLLASQRAHARRRALQPQHHVSLDLVLRAAQVVLGDGLRLHTAQLYQRQVQHLARALHGAAGIDRERAGIAKRAQLRVDRVR